jgi:hypothetical protein
MKTRGSGGIRACSCGQHQTRYLVKSRQGYLRSL